MKLKGFAILVFLMCFFQMAGAGTAPKKLFDSADNSQILKLKSPIELKMGSGATEGKLVAYFQKNSVVYKPDESKPYAALVIDMSDLGKFQGELDIDRNVITGKTKYHLHPGRELRFAETSAQFSEQEGWSKFSFSADPSDPMRSQQDDGPQNARSPLALELFHMTHRNGTVIDAKDDITYSDVLPLLPSTIEFYRGPDFAKPKLPRDNRGPAHLEGATAN